MMNSSIIFCPNQDTYDVYKKEISNESLVIIEDQKKLIGNGKEYQLSGDLNIELFKIVTKLPEIGENNKIYLVSASDDENNKYEEYLYVDNSWELIGSANIKIDLTNYYTKEEIDKKLNWFEA